MAKKVTGKQVKKGILFSVGAQIVSLGVSLLLNLIVPKFISELDYANWQTYMLYVGYVGILHFGLLDVLYHRDDQGIRLHSFDASCIKSFFTKLEKAK